MDKMEDFRLRVFDTLAREGSFTATARALGVSQPAVSQHVAELEKALGAQLFERTRGAAVLTPAGRKFKEYSDQILHWYEEASIAFATDQPQMLKKRAEKKPIYIQADDIYECHLVKEGPADIHINDRSGTTSVTIIQKTAEPDTDPADELF